MYMAVMCCLYWVPVCLVTLIFGFGLVGLVALTALLLCIANLPVINIFARLCYAFFILIGMWLMGMVLLMIIKEPSDDWLSFVTGSVLMLVALAVLVELCIQPRSPR